MKRCVFVLFFYCFVATIAFANEEEMVFSKDRNEIKEILVNTNTSKDEEKVEQDIIEKKDLQKQEEIKQKNTEENIKENKIINENSANNITDGKSQEQEINKQQTSTKSAVKNFVEKWIFPENNPAFGEDGHSIGIQYGYDIGKFLDGSAGNAENKIIHHAAIQYSAPIKFLGVHGRTHLGLGYLYGQDYWAVNLDEGKYNTPLFELIQEVIVGSKYLYLFVGVGVSWVVNAPQNYEMQEVWRKKNHSEDPYNYQRGGLTNFNIPLTIGIGHRFDCGVVLELGWKHYSNGHVAEYNSAVNTIAVGLRYTFGENRKI